MALEELLLCYPGVKVILTLEWPQCWGGGRVKITCGDEWAEVATGDQITETSGNILTGGFSRRQESGAQTGLESGVQS